MVLFPISTITIAKCGKVRQTAERQDYFVKTRLLCKLAVCCEREMRWSCVLHEYVCESSRELVLWQQQVWHLADEGSKPWLETWSWNPPSTIVTLCQQITMQLNNTSSDTVKSWILVSSTKEITKMTQVRSFLMEISSLSNTKTSIMVSKALLALNSALH